MAGLLQIVGAAAVLLAFIAVQRRFTSPDSYPSLMLNLAGSALLAVLAVQERQWGFVLLESVWALFSAWGLAALLLAGRSRHVAP